MLINYSGNVGIGTTSPTSPLTVAGVIQSTTGGFKFPDGTTQTTATAGAGSVSAGAGLTLTGGQFSVNFAGTGVASTASRSDHNHDGAYLKLTGGTLTGPLTFASGQSFPGVLPLTGGTLAGPLTATAFTGDGSKLTNLPLPGYTAGGIDTVQQGLQRQLCRQRRGQHRRPQRPQARCPVSEAHRRQRQRNDCGHEHDFDGPRRFQHGLGWRRRSRHRRPAQRLWTEGSRLCRR